MRNVIWVLLCLLASFSISASEFDHREFSGSAEVTKILASELVSLKNPFCLSRFARTDDMLELYFMTGHYISLIKTEDETRLENQIEVRGVRVSFLLKSPEGQDVWVPSFFCLLK